MFESLSLARSFLSFIVNISSRSAYLLKLTNEGTRTLATLLSLSLLLVDASGDDDLEGGKDQISKLREQW